MSALKSAVGVGLGPDAAAAAREAAARARAKNPDAKLALVIAHFSLDPRAVVAGAKAGPGEIPFVGGSSFAEISSVGLSSQSVVVMTLAGELEFASAAAPLAGEAEETAVRVSAEALARLGRPPDQRGFAARRRFKVEGQAASPSTSNIRPSTREIASQAPQAWPLPRQAQY